jgi:hypothetical protein
MDRGYDWLMQSDVANATVVIIAGSMHLRPGRGRRGLAVEGTVRRPPGPLVRVVLSTHARAAPAGGNPTTQLSQRFQ